MRQKLRDGDVTGLTERAHDGLLQSLGHVGIDVTDDAGTAVTITWEGHSLVLEVQSASQVTGAEARQLANARPAEGSRRPIVVADRITADARALLSSSGWSWLDLRGQLHLRAPGLLVDTAVRPQTQAVVRTPAGRAHRDGGGDVAVQVRVLLRPRLRRPTAARPGKRSGHQRSLRCPVPDPRTALAPRR